MKAYTYVKPGLASFVDVDKPVICKPTDAIAVTYTHLMALLQQIRKLF